MTQTARQRPDPDRIARTLFILTMLGACIFACVILVMTRLSAPDANLYTTPSSPLVRLVPAE
jgi:hypothetical protein